MKRNTNTLASIENFKKSLLTSVKNKDVEKNLNDICAKYENIYTTLKDDSLNLYGKQKKIEKLTFLDQQFNKLANINKEELVQNYNDVWNKESELLFDEKLDETINRSKVFKKHPDLQFYNKFAEVSIISLQSISTTLSKYKFHINSSKRITLGYATGILTQNLVSTFSCLTYKEYYSMLDPETKEGREMLKTPILKSVVKELEEENPDKYTQHYTMEHMSDIINRVKKRIKSIPKDAVATYCNLAIVLLQKIGLVEIDNLTRQDISHNFTTKSLITPNALTCRIIAKFNINYKNLPVISKPGKLQSHEDLKFNYQYVSTRARHTTIMVNKPQTFDTVRTYFNETSFEALNHLQRTPFKINQKELKDYVENFTDLLETHDGIKILKFPNFEDFYESQPDSDLKKSHNRYRDDLVVVNEMLEALVLAFIYKDFKVYFTVSFDFRGRFFYRSWPINPQGKKIFRNLIMFYNYDEIIQYDASSSAFQILGCLTYDNYSLKIFDLIKNKGKGKDYADLYAYIDSFVFNKKQFQFPGYPFYKKLEGMTEDHKTKLKNKDILAENTVKFINSLSKSDYSDRRGFIKKLAMCVAFNQNAEGLSETCIDESVFYETTLIKLFPVFTKNKRNAISIKFCSIARDLVLNQFKYLKELKYCINQIVSIHYDRGSPAVCFYPGGLFQSYHAYKVAGTFRYRYTISKIVKAKIKDGYEKFVEPERRSFSSITELTEDTPLSKKKFGIASVPNITHQFDAIILHLITKHFSDEKIPIWVIHDCFIVPKQYEKKIQEVYKSTLINLFFTEKFEESPIFNILQQNLMSQLNNNQISDYTRNRVLKFYNELKDNHRRALRDINKNSNKVLKEEEPFNWRTEK